MPHDSIYDRLSEWALLARTLVKQANVLAGIEPALGLAALDRARPLIPADNSQLTLAAEMLRVECLIELSKPSEALAVYRRSSPLSRTSSSGICGPSSWRRHSISSVGICSERSGNTSRLTGKILRQRPPRSELNGRATGWRNSRTQAPEIGPDCAISGPIRPGGAPIHPFEDRIE